MMKGEEFWLTIEMVPDPRHKSCRSIPASHTLARVRLVGW